jgi:membrane associated rhomboid family serine protease/TolA-binding protein
VTITLLCVNVALWLLVWLVGRQNGGTAAEALFSHFGVVPHDFNPLTLLTYPFFHVSLAHLLTNMFYLWVFGAAVEEAVGWWRFLLLYLAGGAFGGVLELLVMNALLPPQATPQPIIGASAACAGLVGVFAVRYYRARLEFVGLPWRPHVVVVVAAFLAFEIGSGLWDMSTGFQAGGVAHWAHVGGFIFGLVWGQIAQLSAVGERAYLKADAAQAMDKNVPGAAIKRWEALLAREPNSQTARLELARAWLLLGDTEHASSRYQEALQDRLSHKKRAEAARLYAEMREHDLRVPTLSASELLALGSALEDGEQYALAAETLRALTTHNPDAPEAEMAMIKVIMLYVHRLNRREEARILLHLFLERYPHSQWLNLAQTLRRTITE